MPASGKAIPKSLTAGILLALLIVGGFFRFYKLDESGPFVSDECDYSLEAQFLYTGLSSLAKSFGLFLKERRTGQDLWKRQEQIEAIRESTKGKSPWRGRVGHIYPIALAVAFAGPDVRIGNYVSAVFGLLVVGMGFLVGRRLYGQAAGRAAVGLLLVLLLAEGVLHAFRAILPPPGYPKAMAYMASHKGPKHISSYPAASRAYGGVENVRPGWPETEAELRTLYEQGYRCVLPDFLEVIAARFYSLVQEGEKRERLERSLALLAEIRRSGPPVFECSNPPVTYVQNIFEVNHNFSLSLEAARKARQNEGNIQSIDVYDLEAFFKDHPSSEEKGLSIGTGPNKREPEWAAPARQILEPAPGDPSKPSRGVRPGRP